MFCSLYLVSFFILLFFGMLMFLMGLYMVSIDYLFFIDWEFFTLNSCSLVMSFLFDWMSLLFGGCVLLISSMVIFYSYSYMSGDLYRNRFLWMVLLFVFSMLMMIFGLNLVSILLGWDGLGLVSYCLVIYFQNYKSYNAGMITILTNRIGDVGILLSIGWFLNLGSWNFLFHLFFWYDWMFFVLFLLVLAGFTKSAQIPFSSWLPAAMAAPTPVSALVHSSTLVTAGVYLMIRFWPLFEFVDTYFLVLISLLTMFMSGLGANFEFDLSKIIALSTLSQLGLMMGILFLGFPLLSFFHLLTHAFFKALLFLCAGLIIHCMSDSQDIRHMGGVVYSLPYTSVCFLISSFSLCGLPFLSGFYSKDLILEIYSFTSSNLFLLFLFYFSVGLTVSYSMRLIYYLVWGNGMYVCQMYYEDKIMMSSMFLLTIMSVIFGSSLMWIVFSVPNLIIIPFYLKILPLILILFGGFLGYEFSINYVGFIIYSLKLPFVMFFVGSMWFMPSFSTYMIYSNSLSLSEVFYVCVDSGWVEYLVSNSLLVYFTVLSSSMNFLQFNNLKFIMISFFFILLFFIIY